MRNTRIAAVTGILVFVFLCGYAAGQGAIPKANVGQSQEMLGSMPLTGEFANVEGRMLRLRRITLQPGGVLGLHNHVERPAVTYLVQGQMTYHPEGKPASVINPAQGAGEGKATTHWAENTGTVPAVWIAADIYKP